MTRALQSLVGRWAALRALLALELRTRRRAPWTSLWTLLALALPVAGIAAGGALLRTSQATAAERLAPRFGSSALRIEGLTRAQAETLLRPFVEALEGSWLWSAPLRYERQGLDFGLRAMALESGPAGHGLLHLSGAQGPQGADERLLSPTLLEALGLEPGTTLAASGPIGAGRLLPGSAQLPEDLAAPLLLCAPEALPAATRGALLVRRRDGAPDPGSSAGLPPLARLAISAERQGYGVNLRPQESSGDAFEALAIFLLGGFAVSQAALLIAAALTVGLARRRREIGLLQAQGAARGQLLGATLLATGLEALLAGLLGSSLGALLAALLAPRLDSWNGRWNGPLELSWPHLLLAPVLALVMALLAVGWPARRALAVPILEALGAFRPAHRAPRLTLAVALLALAAALFGWGRWRNAEPNPSLLLASAVLGLLGLCALAPRLLSVAGRAAAVLPLSWRVALRDGSRFPGRDGAVVVATLCASALCVTLLILIQSVDRALQRLPADLPSHMLRLRGESAQSAAEALQELWPQSRSAALQALFDDGQPLRWRAERAAHWIALGTSELLVLLGIPAETLDAARGGLLWLPPEPMPSGAFDPIQAGWEAGSPLMEENWPRWKQPLVLLDPAAATARGFTSGAPPGSESLPWLVARPEPWTRADLEQARANLSAFPGVRLEAALLERQPLRMLPRALILWAWAVGALISTVAGALALSESHRDQSSLHVLGAPPHLLRRMQASRLAYLAALGAALALPAGAWPLVGLLPLANVPIEWRTPWPNLLPLLLGLPLWAYLGALVLWRPPRLRAPERP